METYIKVCVRIRPLEDKEGEAKPSCAFTQALKRNVVMTDKRSLIFDPTDVNKQFMKGVPTHDNKRTKDLCYTFDRVFGEDSQQTNIYQEMVQDLVDGIFKGINCTVFSYGATGAGKSYTISGTPENPGVMPLAMLDLFQRLESQGDFDVVVSYLEVYNETIRDLLADDAKQLDVRESDNGSVVVTNLSTHSPSNEMQVMELLEKGNRNRTKCATKANETSSRSHAVFQINLQLKSGSSGPHTRVSTGTLTLCDLAGSERASVTENKGELLREGANINRSLLALGNCINALCKLDRRRSVGHVPYRDSKLTRLLKNSLAGNCRTVMIANISPSMGNLEETHNTLKYAWRAKQIKLKVKENVVDVKYNISQYLEQIEQLKDENEKLKQELAQFNHSTAPEVRSALIKGINDYYEANENITEISSFDNMSDLELVNALVTKLNGPRAKKLLQFEDNLEKENQVVKEQKPVRKSAHKRQSLLPLPQRSTRATNNIEVSRRTSLLPVPKSTKGKRKLNFTPIKKNINEVEEFLSNTGSDLFDNDVTPKARRISNQPIILSSKKLRDYVFDQERCGSPLFTK